MSTDAELADLASRQYGVVATWQLDLDPKAIAVREAGSRLFRVHRGVYAVGHLGLGREAGGSRRSSPAARAPC